MNRIACRLVAGFLGTAIGLASTGWAAAADLKDRTKRVRVTPPAAAATLIARVVVTPSQEQIAKIRQERRMIGVENRTTLAHQAAGGQDAAAGAL